MRRDALLIILATLGVAGCGGSPSSAQPLTWAHDLRADHPLTGRIWSTAGQRFVSEPELVAALRGRDHVLLGEKHDNTDHHALQARLVRALQPRTIVFEMLDEDDARLLDDLAHSGPDTPADTADAEPPPRSFADVWATVAEGQSIHAPYQPLVEAVDDGQARIVAGNPARGRLRTSMMESLEAAGVDVDALALAPLPDALATDLRDEIVETHCGHAHADLATRMAVGQRLKDAWMADRLLDAHTPTVLITGNGHARTDRGVPLYLRRRNVATDQVATVALLEVRHTADAPTDYDDIATADYVWFTPRVDEIDPCEKFRKALEGLRFHRPPPTPDPPGGATPPSQPASAPAQPAD